MPILGQMDKGGKVEIYSGMLFSHKKKKMKEILPFAIS